MAALAALAPRCPAVAAANTVAEAFALPARALGDAVAARAWHGGGGAGRRGVALEVALFDRDGRPAPAGGSRGAVTERRG